MNILLDTHALIWNFEADPMLPEYLKSVIDNSENEVFISITSLWEMTIKVSLGKLDLSKSLQEIFKHITQVDFKILNVTTEHLLNLKKLPYHHRDPFDRLILAQCQSENLTLVSKDTVFRLYDVPLLWNKD